MMKDIEGFEGRYAVTEEGHVWSYLKNKWLSPYKNGQGYLNVKLLDKDGVSHNKRINILVAEAFLEKPEGWTDKWDAAHLDDNPFNNSAKNLQWQSRAQNLDTDHWREAAKVKIFSKVRCVETGEIFDSQAAAARAIGKHKYGICLCLLGKQKTCGGYHWERVEPDAAVS